MPTTYEGGFSLSLSSEYFKRKYGKAMRDSYDTATPVLSQTRKTLGNTGIAFYEHLQLGSGGSLSAGTLATVSTNKANVQISFARKKVYYHTTIDREAMYASKDEGAFVDAMQHEARQAAESYNRFIEQQLFMEKELDGSSNVIGSGKLGTIASGGVSGSNPYTLTMDSSYKQANFEVGDIVNIEAGNTDRFEVQAVTSTTITVFRNSGSQVPAQTDEVFMQNSEDNTLISLEGITSFASGENLYGAAHQYRFEPGVNYDASSSGITTEMLSEQVSEIMKKSGKPIDAVFTSWKQWNKLAAQYEDLKRVTNVTPKRKDLDVTLGFTGLQFVHPGGVANIFPSRFIDDDKLYFVNTNKLELKHAHYPKWFEEDGTIWLRSATADEYSARYGAYLETYANPVFHGRIHSLA